LETRALIGASPSVVLRVLVEDEFATLPNPVTGLKVNLKIDFSLKNKKTAKKVNLYRMIQVKSFWLCNHNPSQRQAL
jgi:hypothetical protein